MNRWRLLTGTLLSSAALSAPRSDAANLSQRSISGHGQIIVYCSDVPLRMRVASVAEETKSQILPLLGRLDSKGFPIVVNIEPESAADARPAPSQVQVIEVENGFKVQVDVRIGSDVADVELQKQLVRALLLELEYRAHPELLRGGTRYAEPPSWLLEGIMQLLRTRETGADAALYDALLATNQLPEPRTFLLDDARTMDSTSLSLYRAYSLSLLQLLMELPNGRASLGRYVASLPHSNPDPVSTLTQHFPALGDKQGLVKLWTLSLARLAAGDRYKVLTPAATEQQLARLLEIDLPATAKSPKRSFKMEDYKQFVRLPAARAVLEMRAMQFVALAAKASPLFRPIVVEYENIAQGLARRKSRGVAARLAAAADYRLLVLKRTEEIADYLNWFEVTQPTVRSHSFDAYIKAANNVSRTPVPREDSISKYLDAVALQIQ